MSTEKESTEKERYLDRRHYSYPGTERGKEKGNGKAQNSKY